MSKPDGRRFKLGEEVGILSVWLVVLLAMCLLSERLRMYGNLQILLLNGSVIAFLALGQAFVLLTGGIDGLVKPDVSLQKTTEMLQAHPDINLIWADTGPAAQGALRAVKSLNAQAKVYGFAIADYPVESLYPAAAFCQMRAVPAGFSLHNFVGSHCRFFSTTTLGPPAVDLSPIRFFWP
jgi:ABC-type glucose/galactose transport system permease subunit